MKTLKDVEAYLLRLGKRFSRVEDDGSVNCATFLISSSPSGPTIALRVDPPLVIARVRIGDARGVNDEALFRKLLQLNTKGLVHASFGLDGNEIVLTSALELSNLDFNEVEAVVDELDLAICQHVPQLASHLVTST